MVKVENSTRAVAVTIAVVVNTGGAVQARLNGELAARLHDGIAAPLISTAIGLLLLAAIVPALPAGRRALGEVRTAFRTRTLRWWHGLGGMCGALFVASQGVSVGSLGVAAFTVAVVAGNTTGGLLIDRWGLGPSGRHPLTRARVGAAVVCVVAVAIASGGRLNAQGLLLVGLPLVAGAVLAWQTAVNGKVGAVAGSVLAATLLNFVVAVLTLVVAFLVGVSVRGFPAGELPREPWLYGGGLIGISLIVVAAAVVARTGVLVFGLASVSGQLLGAAGVDVVGSRTTAATWIALGLTSTAVIMATRARSSTV